MVAGSSSENRVLVIGADSEALIDLYSLALHGGVDEIVLVGGGSEELALGLTDLLFRCPTRVPITVMSGTVADSKGAKLAVYVGGLTSGSEENQSLSDREEAFRSAAGLLKENQFDSALLIINKPVDKLTNIAVKEMGFNERRTFGLGLGRSRSGLGDLKATWCTAVSEQTDFADNCHPDCPRFDRLLTALENKKGDVIDSSAPRTVELAACVTQICGAVVTGTHTVVSLYTPLNKQLVPSGATRRKTCVIGEPGIIAVLDETADNEQMAFAKRSYAR